MKAITNTAEIRSQNKKKIVEHLRSSHSSTKKDLAQKLNLSYATVSNLCNQLIEENVLRMTSSHNSNGGRIPGLLLIAPNSRYTLCLNVIAKKDAEIAVVNLKNEIVALEKFRIPDAVTFQELVKIYHDISCKLLDKHGIDKDKILGIGIAAPGIYSKNTGCIINSTNPDIENKPLKSQIESVFGLPAYVENESNLLVLSAFQNDEELYSNKDMIYLFIGEGLGVGIISNGKLLTGSHGLGGEISHVPLGNKNYECYCGKTNCVESEVILSGFLRKYFEACGTEPLYGKECWDQFIDKSLNGDETAMKIMEENGRIIGKVISMLANLFDPEAFYIGGIIEKAIPVLYPYITEEATGRMAIKGQYDFKIHFSVDYENLIFKGCNELVLFEWMP